MNTSDTLDQLATALATAQASMGPALSAAAPSDGERLVERESASLQ